MISWNVRTTCDEARLHYYDCLDASGRVDVPPTIREHVTTCPHCRREIERLDRMLNKGEHTDEKPDSRPAMINSLLNLHFRHAGCDITCSTAKLFLAGMADPQIAIRVPTPITTHIDRCVPCSDDLKTLEALTLSNDQLRRLHQFFSDSLTKHTEPSHAYDHVIHAIAAIRFADIDVATLKHVCRCDQCLRRVREDRRQQASTLVAGEGRTLCRTIQDRDLFDYVLPYGANPLSGEYHKFRQVLVDHLRQCPNCLNRMLDMDRRVHAIRLRPDSGVITCFHIRTRMETDQDLSLEEGAYEGYPVYVDVRHLPAKRDVACDVTGARETSSKRGFPPRTKHLSWGKIAATIVLVFGLSVAFWPHRVGAGFFDKVYEATLAARVVHIEMIEPMSENTLQDIWLFPEDNRVILKEKEATTALDLRGGSVTILDHQSGQLDTGMLKADIRRHMEQQIRTLFSLMPYGFQSLPAKVSDELLDQGAEVYEVQWTDGAGAAERSQRWVAYVDPSSQRLREVHWYTENPFTGTVDESRRYYIDYPDPGHIEHLLEQVQPPTVRP